MFNIFNTLLPHLENKELPVSYYWFGQKQGTETCNLHFLNSQDVQR